MRKHWFHSIGLGGLSAIGLMLGLQQAASAADDVKMIEIKREKGKFVFADPNIKINAGQSVEWFAKIPGAHQLEGDPPFKATVEFTDKTTQKFDKPGVMNYHCTFHESMKGTITVK